MAVSDELESLRDHIDALEATKARQEVRACWRGARSPAFTLARSDAAACEACQAVRSNEILCYGLRVPVQRLLACILPGNPNIA